MSVTSNFWNLLMYDIFGYLISMMPFIPMYKRGMFEYLISKTKKNSDEKLRIAHKFAIPATKDIVLGLLSYPKYTTENYYKRNILKENSDAENIYAIIISNIFFMCYIIMLTGNLYRAMQAEKFDQILLSVLWFVFGIWRYSKLISFFKNIKLEMQI